MTSSIFSFDIFLLLEKYVNVYKFHLKRIIGQPPLTTNQVHFVNRRALHISSTKNRTICEDIFGGQENLRIRVINEVDDTPAPTGFKYAASNQIGENVKLPSSASGCKCIGTCTDHKIVHVQDLIMVQTSLMLLGAMDVVYECGPNYGCGPDCINRVSQGGIKYQLETMMGMGGRQRYGVWADWDHPYLTLDPEYEAAQINVFGEMVFQGYIFRGRKPVHWSPSSRTALAEAELEKRVGSIRNRLMKAENINENPEFSIDAGSTGNVSKFINYSCDPNLFVQCILSDCHDLRLARVFLLAS